MICALLGSVYVIKLGTNEWTELRFWDERVFGTTLGDMEGLLLGTLDRIEI